MSANKSLLYNNTGRQVLLYDIIGRPGDYYILLHVFVVKINQVFIAWSIIMGLLLLITIGTTFDDRDL